MDLGSISWGHVAICAGVIVWFAVAVYLTRKPKGNPPEVYRYTVSFEYVGPDGARRRECPDQPVSVTLVLPDDSPRNVVIYRGPISRK